MKSPFKSKILLTNASAGLFFILDALNGFMSSGGLDNLCAQKSALAGGIMALTGILRYYFTSEAVGLEKKDD